MGARMTSGPPRDEAAPSGLEAARTVGWLVRRWFNQHDCAGPGCRHPRHVRDVTDCRTVLQAIGLLPTPGGGASITTTGMPARRRASCPACGRLIALATRGVLNQHRNKTGGRCPGTIF